MPGKRDKGRVKGPRLRKLRLRIVIEFGVAYTHEDRGGVVWRFDGARPVSALADQVMAECGLLSPSVGFIPHKVKLVLQTSQRTIRRQILLREAEDAATVRKVAQIAWTLEVFEAVA